MEKDYKMIDAMERFGGSFVKALAQCMLRADSENYDRLLDAFPEYVKQYTRMAQERRVEK